MAEQSAEPLKMQRDWRRAMQIDDVMALVDEYVSASIEDHGYRSGAASAEYLEDTKRKLLAAIAALIAAPAAPQQAEPVEQIGWSDEFGNLFPMGAWKPAQRTHHDSHKAAWRPVFLHPPAAEVQRLREALEYLIEKCGDSDDAQYSTLGTKFVRDIARRALEGGE